MVPKGWSDGELGDIAHITSGGTPSRDKIEYWVNGTIPWIRTTEVQNCVLNLEDAKEFITEIGLKKSSAKLVPAGSILLAMIGQGKTRGQVALLNFEATTNQNCAVIIFNANNDPAFYFHYLLSQYENIRGASNSAGQSNLSGSLVKTIRVPIPPLIEQQQIAQILSTWDQAISVTEKLLENTVEKKDALMQQLLTGKKHLLNENGEMFSGTWKSTKVKDIFIPDVLLATNQDFPIFSVTKAGLVNQSEYFNKAVASEDTSKYRVVKKGRFVMSGLNFWMGSVDVHLIDYPVIVSPAYKVFEITNLTSPEFMKYFIRSNLFKRLLEVSSVVGASVVRRNFSESIFNNYEFLLPSLEEQKKIAEVLSLADQEIETLQKKLDCLKQEKKALMQQLLTGKKRVKVAA
ncbi:restriction endonuclease subunit S [Acinetobacter soli]|uniref:restriction endonuclease subunit S n=1 Tax=Acinetobacter soli TaxID=487316 RepID=UPI0032B4E68C